MLNQISTEAQGQLGELSLPPLPATGTACISQVLRVQTERGPQFIDITPMVEAVVAGSEVHMGMAAVFSRHTTAAIKINESEPLLIADMCERLTNLFPPCEVYRHNDFTIRSVNMTDDEEPNGHSHCQHLLLSTSEIVPVVWGKVALGRWQRIFLVELDRARPREVVVMVFGVPAGGGAIAEAPWQDQRAVPAAPRL